MAATQLDVNHRYKTLRDILINDTLVSGFIPVINIQLDGGHVGFFQECGSIGLT